MTTSSLLNSLAVARKSGDDASEILQAYMDTAPEMVLSHIPAPAAPGLAKAPKGTGAGDKFLEPQ